MRIGIDARIWSETTGRYVRNLVHGLQSIDDDNQYFIFVMGLEEAKIKKTVTKDNFKIVPTSIKIHSLDEQINYAGEIEKFDLDIMHFTYFSLPIRYKRPFIVTIHDLIIHHFPTGRASTLPFPLYYLKRLAYLYLVQKSADKASAIIAVSQATKGEIVDHLQVAANKINVIYEGVDNAVLPQNKERIIKSPYILYVGNAYPHKNLERLIEAFQKARTGDQKLVLVGKQNFFYKRIEKEMKKKKINDVIFFGEATDSQLSSLYAFANAYVMPSLMEGFGLPPLEAMANNCLVLASDIPSLKEICADGAVYFDPYKTSDITDKITFAFSQEDKSSYIKKGKERVRGFSWDKMARETLNLYESSFSIRQSK